PGTGDPYRDGAAQRVTEQVHRPPVGVLDPADHPTGDGRDRVAPGRVTATEPRKVDGLTGKPVRQQPGEVGPVGRGATETVDVQGGLGVRGGRGRLAQVR